PQHTSTLFPYTTLFRSQYSNCNFAIRTFTDEISGCAFSRASAAAFRAIEGHPWRRASDGARIAARFRSPVQAAHIHSLEGLRARSEEHTSELQSPYDLV